MADRPLQEYKRKRNARQTPEPMGDASTAGGNNPGNGTEADQLTFVIQEHHARRLHWDFRLERDGVLVSWAVPKGLPPDPAVNHLAVHVEDHPLEYGSFSGTIPDGQYGAGSVAIWDHGLYETEKWTDREVKVVLHGERSAGRFVLFKTKEPNWMIHRMDGPEFPGWLPIPKDLEPMLPADGELAATASGSWAYDLDWPGLRVLVAVEGGRLRVTGPGRQDVTNLFPELAALGLHLGSTQVLFDGVIVTFGGNGRPDAAHLAERVAAANPSAIRQLATKYPATFLAFDLLHRDGRPLLDASYDDRRRELEGLGFDLPAAQITPAFDERTESLGASAGLGLPGVVAKKRTSRYEPGEATDDWVRIPA